MNNSISLLFYIKKSKVDDLGNANIYLRITVDGKRSELSIRRKVAVNRWNSKAGLANGSSKEINELNRYLSAIKNKIFQMHQRFIEKEETVTASSLRDAYVGKDKNAKMLMQIFQDHNDQIERLIGIDFSANTLTRYKTTKNHLKNYLIDEYSVIDIALKKVDIMFINSLEYYLKTVKKCSHNTAFKYVSNLKKIIRIAYRNGWIAADPFINYKTKFKIVDREFLLEDEIKSIIEKETTIERLNVVKDIFIFCCFTGLAYIDVKKLSKDNILLGIDGEYWVKTKRTKTDSRTNIPILPIAQSILNKYTDHPDISNSDKVLPVLSNQKMNTYLKEIADICGIQKNLTFHLARHTFATTVTLNNGVPIESVSKMLGHKSLRATQHYAKILDRKVSDDMKTLREKFNKDEKLSQAVY
tara:strand:- start:765 stop:2006 length:1242 start_codon:yes stop_codon:yes gene_type:complete